MYYINMKTNGVVETIDETPSRKEAVEWLKEYAMSGHEGVYISTRSTKEWREK